MFRRFRQNIEETYSYLTDSKALDQTLRYLVADGEISEGHATILRTIVSEQLVGSRYILRHLGAHLAIGLIFAFDIVPIPLGTIARVAWVACNRIVESARRNRDRSKIHSIGVFLIAAIPWLGYAAYLLPLRKHNRELAFVLANHIWLNRTGRTYEQFLAETYPFLKWIGRRLVPFPEKDGKYAA